MKKILIILSSLLIISCSNNSDSGENNSDNLSIENNYLGSENCSEYSEGTTKGSGILSYVNWANYTSPKILSCFQELTGIHIIQSYTTDDNMTKAKLLTGHTGYDVVEQGTLYLPFEIPAGAFEEIDTTRLSNYKNRNKSIYDKVAEINDPGNKYAIIYSYGTTGVGYNAIEAKARLPEGEVPNDWKYLFDSKYLSKFSDCGISFLDEPEQVFGNLLYYLGKDPNSTNPNDYKEAAQYLIKNVRPYLTYFDSNRYENDLASGDLCLVMGYSGDVMRSYGMSKASHANTQIRYALPTSGASVFFDALMIPKGAKNIDAAYDFLNYTMNPKVAATNSNFIYQPNAVEGSLPYMIDIFKDPNVNPTPEMIAKMYVIELWQPKLQDYINRLWFSVKFGIDVK
ncbi:extracellular solute-binding protein [Francisellaceae bacterium]|nr:extracellular solute-binding protein [Francisellaceae bacterium]